MRRSKAVAIAPWLPLALLLLFAAQSASALVTVGPGAQCEFKNVQAAIDKVIGRERNNFNVDPYIGVAGGNVYNEALVIDSTNVGTYDVFGASVTGAFVQIYGDYDADCQTENASPAKISAGGNVGNSVLEIKGSRLAHVVLNRLTLSGARGPSKGGGINFHGIGKLDLSNIEISNNQATWGGGINVTGNGGHIDLTLGVSTVIAGNTATNEGGGIQIEGDAYMLMNGDASTIYHNSAGSRGGGIQVVGPALADIGSPGYYYSVYGISAIDGNSAAYGGGIALVQDGIARLFSSFASAPGRIEHNTASATGGGVYVEGNQSNSRLYGYGYGINSNTAANGAAIYVDVSSSTPVSGVELSENVLLATGSSTKTLPPRAPCSSGIACNSISGNTATQDDGAAILVQNYANFSADHVVLTGNAAGRALQVIGVVGTRDLADCLVSANPLRHDVVRIDQEASATISNCTLAGNTLPAGTPVFSINGPIYLNQSIVWQPDWMTVVASRANMVSFMDVITRDADSINPAGFGAYSNVHSYDPGFVDAANRDYHLKPESLAIDYAPTPVRFNGSDLDGFPRPVDLFGTSTSTPYDIGAYERQSPGDVIFFDGMERAF